MDHLFLAKLPVFTTTIRRWLKAGVVEFGHFSPTVTGSPQGGIYSPLLANVALDGMERLFGCEWPDGRPRSPAHRRGIDKGISLIRYADDFVVTAPTRDVLETHGEPRIEEFLRDSGPDAQRGEDPFVEVNEAFGFLGFHIRKFGRGEDVGRAPGGEGRQAPAGDQGLPGHAQAKKTGWDLLQEVEGGLDRFWSITSSHVYRELRTLEDRGLVKAGATGSRDRRPFTITAAGRRAFRRWISKPPGPEQIRFPLLVSLWFARHIDPETLAGFLQSSREDHEHRLALYEDIEHSMVPDDDRASVVRFGIAYEQSILDWLDDTAARHANQPRTP